VKERIHFIGVSTGSSSIMQIFPRWAALLDLDAEISGRDIPLGAEPSAFHEVVEEIAREENVRGALVTTHKVGVFEHARDFFAELDEHARVCREISCVSKRDGQLIGRATDPITAGRALRDMLGPDYWSGRTAHALCLGAGGAGTAITVALLGEPTPPEQIVVTDTSPARIDALRKTHEQLDVRSRVDCHVISAPEESDALLASLPRGSLVVNATGMGKDVPGSPITDAARFPEQGVVWELNYRGALDFLNQARGRAEADQLELHDGWRYFLHGWTEVIAEVFQFPLRVTTFEQLAAAADRFRPRSPATV
jgi:shikimate 5-dehydrogenase